MEGASESDPKRILKLLYRKKSLFFFSAAFVATAIILVSYLVPRKYEAKTVFFMERNVLNELIKTVTVTSSFEEKIKALSIVMKSRTMILKVMEELNLGVKGKGPGDLEPLIKSFQDRTKVDIEINKATRKDMDLFVVSFTDSNPKLATDFVNTLVRRYIQDNLSLKREEAYGASEFLLDQINTFKTKLDKIETAMGRQRKEKTTDGKTLTPVDRLEALVRKKNELLLQYTENHPDVIKIKAEIEMVKEQLKYGPTAAGPDIALLDLERERDTTKKIYEDLLSTLRKSEVSTQVEVQDKAGAFRILDPAIEPTKPVSPKMGKMILIAILGGIAAGIGLLMLAEMSDGSVKSPETLKKLGLPVLAVISTMQTEEEAAASRQKDRRLYAVAGAYLAGLLVLASLEAMDISSVDKFMQGAKVEINNALKKMWQKT